MTCHADSWRWTALVAGALALMTLGCSSLQRPRDGDGYFDAGSWSSAVAVYERRLRDGDDSEDLRLRLALARAAPGHAATDLDRAVELVEGLVGSPRTAGRAAALLAIFERQRRVESELVQALQARQATEVRLEEQTAWFEALATSLEMSQLRTAELEDQLQRLRRQAERLRTELQELKRIDLGPAR